jgi:hypothetical protein
MIRASGWKSLISRNALARLGVSEQPHVIVEAHPAVPAGEVVAEVERLLVERHEDLRVELESLVEGRAATLEHADMEEIGLGGRFGHQP